MVLLFYTISEVYTIFGMVSDVGIVLTQHGEKTSAVFYHDMLNYVSAHSVYFKMIFSPHNTSGLYQNLLKMYIGIERMVLSEQLGTDYPESDLTCVVRYHVNGCFAVIADWVTTGFDQSQDYIVKMLSELDKGLRAYLSSRNR